MDCGHRQMKDRGRMDVRDHAYMLDRESADNARVHDSNGRNMDRP